MADTASSSGSNEMSSGRRLSMEALKERIKSMERVTMQNWESNEGTEQVAKVALEALTESQVLKSLTVNYSKSFGSVESCKELGELVRRSQILTDLSMHGVGMNGDGLEHIVRGLFDNPRSALVRLEVGSNVSLRRKGAELFTELISRGPPALKIFGMWGPGFTPDEMAPVARALAQNTTLEQISVGSGYGITFPDRDGPLNYVLRALTPVERLTPEQQAFQNHRHNSTVRFLSMNYEYELGLAESLTEMLRDNSTLTMLGLRFFGFNRAEWKKVFDLLKHNYNIQWLDLTHCGDGLNDAFEDLMELLEANYTLKAIQLYSTPLEANGRAELVKQMLARNDRLANYIRTLKDNLKFVPPTIGRLFLCGPPMAGKTTLRRTMVDTQGNRAKKVVSQIRGAAMKHPCLPTCGLGNRTQGIEIRLLKDTRDQHISVWDLAGQDEYHALHDSHYMFPDINQACVFLFLFSPHDLGRNDAEQGLRKQLHYWLSFINSNSRKTGWMLPKVSVVLTHLDMLSDWFGKDRKCRAENYINWAAPVVNVLRETFKGRLELHPKVHAVDAFSYLDAHQVVDHVFQSFSEIFTTLRKVPAACEEMSLVLAKWTSHNKSQPLIRSDKFFELCKNNVDELKKLFQSREIPQELLHEDAVNAQQSNAERNQLAVASYLHDVGSIIHFPETGCIVVNPNWLGQVFLGQLFRPGDPTYDPILKASQKGIVSKISLEAALQNFIRSKRYTGFDKEDLIKLMTELKLCYEVVSTGPTDGSHFFIPSTLSDPENLASRGTRQLKWNMPRREKSVCLGLRLQSSDPDRTLLSLGIFQRFQVHLYKFLDGQDNVRYEIERNLIRVTHDGVEMLVESSGECGDYVDVLMRSNGPAAEAKRYSYKYVVDEFRAFCASRAGCPGVALEEAILRPECVTRLILCIYRKDQAVVKEKLKQQIVKKLFESNELLSQIWTEGAYENSITKQTMDEKMYRHSFPAVPQAGLSDDWVNALDMIDFLDVQAAIFEYRVSVSQQRYAIFQAVDELKSNVTVADAPSTSSAGFSSKQPQGSAQSNSNDNLSASAAWEAFIQETERRMADESAPQMRNVIDFGLRMAKALRGAVTDGTKQILDKLDEHKLLLLHLQKSMDDMQMLHQVRQVTLIEKIDQLSGHFDRGDMPRIPYFTDEGVGMRQRLVALVKIGNPLKLHFMCEDPGRVHYLKEQIGSPIVNLLQGDVYKKLRPLVSYSIKVMFVLVKAGLHVAAGLGNAIPDFSTQDGAMPITVASLTGESLMSEIKGLSANETSDALAEAWRVVQDVVSPLMMQGRIPEVFQLYKVQFKAEFLEKHLPSRNKFWVCSDCRQRAASAGHLEDFNELDCRYTPRGIVRAAGIKS